MKFPSLRKRMVKVKILKAEQEDFEEQRRASVAKEAEALEEFLEETNMEPTPPEPSPEELAAKAAALRELNRQKFEDVIFVNKYLTFLTTHVIHDIRDKPPVLPIKLKGLPDTTRARLDRIFDAVCKDTLGMDYHPDPRFLINGERWLSTDLVAARTLLGLHDVQVHELVKSIEQESCRHLNMPILRWLTNYGNQIYSIYRGDSYNSLSDLTWLQSSVDWDDWLTFFLNDDAKAAYINNNMIRSMIHEELLEFTHPERY